MHLAPKQVRPATRLGVALGATVSVVTFEAAGRNAGCPGEPSLNRPFHLNAQLHPLPLANHTNCCAAVDGRLRDEA
jgi:hypothetical protein